MAEFRASVEITAPDGRVGVGRVSGQVSLQLEGDRLRVSDQHLGLNLESIKFNPDNEQPAIGGRFKIRIDRWNFEFEDSIILARTSGNDYTGSANLDDVPDGLRALYEEAPKPINVRPEPARAEASILAPTVTLEQSPSIRSSAEIAAQLSVALGHVEEIRGFIRAFLAKEPTDFERAIVEALRVEIDSLYDDMEEILAGPAEAASGRVHEVLTRLKWFAGIARNVKDVVQLAGYVDDLLRALGRAWE